MPKKPVELGEHRFSSKKEAKEHYKSILNSVPLGTELGGDEFDQVMALLLSHPNAIQKIRDGVKALKVDRGKYEGNRCFHVVRTDGTVENFSIGKCIDGEWRDFHKFCVAARNAVEKEIAAFKQSYFAKNQRSDQKVRCQNGGGMITFSEAHVDHREPFTFSAIVHFFVDAKDVSLQDTRYVSEGRYGHEFADAFLADSFREWHQRHAKLRVVAAGMNLKKGYLGRVASTKSDGFLQG